MPSFDQDDAHSVENGVVRTDNDGTAYSGIYFGNGDPNDGLGTPAPVGSTYNRHDVAQVWKKQDSGDKSWVRVDIFGGGYWETDKNIQENTSSDTYVTYFSGSTVSLPAGIYLVSWNATLGATTNNKGVEYEFKFDGASIGGTSLSVPRANGFIEASSFLSIELLTSGVKDFEFNYKRIDAGVSAVLKRAGLTIWGTNV